MKKYFLVLVLSLCCVLTFASSFSFQLIQHCDGLDEVCPSVQIFEDELLNYFFENGQIVSNEPAAVSVSKKQDSKLVQTSFVSASDGSFNNFIEIHAYLNDSDGSAGSDAKVKYFNKISWKIYSVKTGKVTAEDTMNVSKSEKSDSGFEVSDLAVELALKLQEALKSRA